MRTLRILLHKELRAIFFSPTAYIVLALVMLLNGVSFYAAVKILQKNGLPDRSGAVPEGRGNPGSYKSQSWATMEKDFAASPFPEQERETRRFLLMGLRVKMYANRPLQASESAKLTVCRRPGPPV